MIRIKTQNVLKITGEISFKWLFLPKAAFRTQPKGYGGAILQKQLTGFSYSHFSQKTLT